MARKFLVKIIKKRLKDIEVTLAEDVPDEEVTAWIYNQKDELFELSDYFPETAEEEMNDRKIDVTTRLQLEDVWYTVEENEKLREEDDD